MIAMVATRTFCAINRHAHDESAPIKSRYGMLHVAKGFEQSSLEKLGKPMKGSLEKQNVDTEAVIEAIQHFSVETPSWGYGDSGTRFKTFHWPGAARNLH